MAVKLCAGISHVLPPPLLALQGLGEVCRFAIELPADVSWLLWLPYSSSEQNVYTLLAIHPAFPPYVMHTCASEHMPARIHAISGSLERVR